MIVPPRNRFGLLDLMILIAGTAFAFWIVPEGWAEGSSKTFEIVALYGWSSISAKRIGSLLTQSQPIAAVGTATLLVLACRRSHSLRELTDDPGFMACSSATSATLVIGLLNFASTRINVRTGIPLSVRTQVYLVDALTFRQAECGVAVASAWVTLLLIGHWRPRADWIDRSGSAIGFFWIAMIPISRLGFPV